MDTVTSELAIDTGRRVGAEPAVPYAPSWIDRVTAWLEALPGPTWLAYTVLFVVAWISSLYEPLVDGAMDAAAIAIGAFWSATLPLSLWLVRALAGVAGSAFDAFRPALEATDDEAARWRYRLTVIPARPSWVILGASVVLTLLYYVADPEGSDIVGLSDVTLVLRYANEVVFGALVLALLAQSFRQLRDVRRIHASATRVDLFQPAPLYAFSILTSRTAMVIALLFTLPTLLAAATTPAAANAVQIALPWLLLGVVAAAIVFVVPLWGMQRRIIEEKHRLQTAVGARIEATMERLHERVDAGDAAEAQAQHGVLQALAMERDLVERLPTLPWRPGTLGAIVSAVIAPLGIFILTRLIERVI